MTTAGQPENDRPRAAEVPVHNCPRCRAVVGPRDSTCPQCGVDLALAAVLMERLAISQMPTEPGTPYLADVLLPRFGEFLVKGGYLTEAQVEVALARQRELAGAGTRRTLGQVLLELGFVTRRELDLASVEQVQELQNALRQMNAQLEQRVAERTRELQHAYRKLADLDRLKGNFIANISHELRTPLTKIKGFTALLATEDLGPLTPDQDQALEVMGRGVEELEQLIVDLIQFASGARGEMLLRPTAFALGDLVEWIVANLSIRASKRGVTLEIDAPPDLPQVVGDAEKLRWVLNQLLDNALKFTEAGGRVRVVLSPDGFVVRVSVEDTGTGIGPAHMSELFEPFHQLDGSTTRRQGGAGLGLALVKLIMEAHDTTIQVSSQPGVGTRFWFELPAESVPASD